MSTRNSHLVKTANTSFASENVYVSQIVGYNIHKHIPKVHETFTTDFKNHFSETQNWVGYVIEIKNTTFFARIEDARAIEGTFEEVEIDRKDIEDEDLELLQVGSVFYWSVGYEYRNGTKSKQSIFRFKRLPKWTSRNIDAAKDLADDLFNNLNWED